MRKNARGKPVLSENKGEKIKKLRNGAKKGCKERRGVKFLFFVGFINFFDNLRNVGSEKIYSESAWFFSVIQFLYIKSKSENNKVHFHFKN